MQKRGNRICPCCGKPLELIAPTKEDLLTRMEESANKVPYYYQCKMRFLSYTRKPIKRFVMPRDRGYFLDRNIDPYGRGLIVPRGNDCRINTVLYTQRRIDEDRLFFFDSELVFLCRSCRKKLSINHNPFSFFFVPVIFWGIATMLTVMMTFLLLLHGLSVSRQALNVILFIALTALVFTASDALFVLIYYVWLKKYISNFVPTDEYDTLVRLPENLKIRNISLTKKYLHPYNIFETELDDERFFLYLTEKGERDFKLHICGLKGEPKRLLALIREKQSRGETVTLPLTFEGKAVGSAEVLETYDPPEPVEQAADDEEYITVWQCRHCGYDNPVGTSECKSCGRWKE